MTRPHRRRRLALALVGLLASVSLVAGSSTSIATADTIDDQKKSVDAQIAALKDTLEGANADFVAAAVEVKKSEIKLSAAQAALAAAQRRLAAAVARQAELAVQLSVAQAEQAKAERQLTAGDEARKQTETQLGRIAAHAYTGGGLNGLSIALQADSAQQFVDQMSAARAALRAQSSQLDRLSVMQADLRANSAELAAAKAQVAELERQAGIVVTQRQDAQDAAAAAESEVAASLAQQKVALAAIQSKIATERSRLDALAAEQNKLEAQLAERAKRLAAEEAARRAHQGNGSGSGSGSGSGGGSGDSGGGQPSGGGYLSYPAAGPITSGFGMRYHPILHIYRLHSGTDFGVPCGTPVHAAADGDVISAGWAGGYGNRVVIDHGWVRGVDLATTYNHLTSIVVGGGHVGRGQLIGYSGTTGLSTGCHLHFETLVNGSFANPMNWL